MPINKTFILSMALIGAVGAGATSASHAEQPHTVRYYVTHPAERTARIRTCMPGAERSVENIECANAQQAGWYFLEQSARQQVRENTTPESDIESPQYWVHNALARKGALAECAHPPAHFGPTAAECAAAAKAEAWSHR